MYREMNIQDLKKLNYKVITEKEYFLDLLENPNIIDHQDGSLNVNHRSKWITVDNEEILILIKI